MSDQLPFPNCWIVCDEGKVGTQNQCVGLAEGLGYTPQIFQVKARFPWSLLPASLWPCALSGLEAPGLVAPWPSLIIGAGRACVAPTAAIRTLTKGKTRVIQLQNPRVNPALFDVIISPRHDGLKGPNVIETKGALHRVTTTRLVDEAARFAPLFEGMARPITTVLIGGTNRCYDLTPEVMRNLVAKLKAALSHTGGSLAVTISRRTEPENLHALEEGLKDLPAVLWNGQGENPYFGFLGLADYVVVTSDSVSMTSEACATGKPVYVAFLPGGSSKFKAFHRFFHKEGHTRPFEGVLEDWPNPPLQEMDGVISLLRTRFNLGLCP
jgi:uncharacterized protein